MIVEVLVPQRHGDDPLSQQIGQRMRHLLTVAPVIEACRHPPEQIQPTGYLTQQQPARIRGDFSPVERPHDHPPTMIRKPHPEKHPVNSQPLQNNGN